MQLEDEKRKNIKEMNELSKEIFICENNNIMQNRKIGNFSENEEN